MELTPRKTLVGSDPKMIEIYKTIGVLSRNRATVLVRGETGTGKEVIARAIHTHSAYSDQPFIAVNCTALTDTLLESELFGHVKGAYPGAVNHRKGYFELAGRGTIFLDEIGDTSPEFQTKLLRVLQERRFYPVGSESARETQARVIAATHQPVEDLVVDGSFREDLYFRLKVVEIRVPPLRERPSDIGLIATALLGRIRVETHRDVRRISDDAMLKWGASGWRRIGTCAGSRMTPCRGSWATPGRETSGSWRTRCCARRSWPGAPSSVPITWCSAPTPTRGRTCRWPWP
ncbi:MAG: sigma 54-interacting transcriptional regulator [Gemmatimonadota bacterium]